MACCALQPGHRILTLRSAMALAYKLQDFVYAAYFAKKIIQLSEVKHFEVLRNINLLIDESKCNKTRSC
jgi:hypothetical protein